MAAQVHEGEEAKKPVVIGVEIAVLERDVLAVPEALGELAPLRSAASKEIICLKGLTFTESSSFKTSSLKE